MNEAYKTLLFVATKSGIPVDDFLDQGFEDLKALVELVLKNKEERGEMIEFHATEWITITGRGKVALIADPWDDLSLLKGQIVLIDGVKYLVTGTESFSNRKPSGPFGLFVREFNSKRENR